MKMVATSSVLFENSLGCISYEPAGYLRLHWQAGPRDSQPVRTLFAQTLRAQVQTGCAYLLIDERLASAFQEAEKAWLTEEWLPYWVAQAGRYYVAHLAATDVYARLSTVGVMAKARSIALSHCLFTNETDAVHWLLRQPVS